MIQHRFTYRIVSAVTGRKFTTTLLLGIALLISVPVARAEIKSMSAHDTPYAPGSTVPVFVDSGAKNSIMVKGPFMDLCIGVEAPGTSFNVSIGRRIVGSNSSVEILVGAGSVSDQAEGTINIKFVSGQETFTVKAFKARVSSLSITGRSTPTCQVGELITLEVHGDVDHLDIGVIGAMLDVADNRYDLGARVLSSSADITKFRLKCTAAGTFVAKAAWFRDSRVPNPAGDAMVRGSATLPVMVTAPH